MKVIGSVIARLESKRLRYKNLLPFGGLPMLGLGIEKLKKAKSVTQIVVSTESELIARIAYDFGVTILRRPQELAADNVPSIPVFQHIMQHFPGDVHVNLNVNFPLCDPAVVDRAVEVAAEKGEALSEPYAVWAQRADRLANYGDFWKLPEIRFKDERAGKIDVHTEEEWLETLRQAQDSKFALGWANGIIKP